MCTYSILIQNTLNYKTNGKKKLPKLRNKLGKKLHPTKERRKSIKKFKVISEKKTNKNISFQYVI